MLLLQHYLCYIIIYNFPFTFFFFFNDTATTEIYTLSLHDALPISMHEVVFSDAIQKKNGVTTMDIAKRLIDYGFLLNGDRKSTRLNSSHRCISYAVFCLKKKKKKKIKIILNNTKQTK